MFLVVCEGETEEEYIKLLKRFYRLPVTIKTKVTGNCINSRLVNQYIKELDVEPDDCSVFYVYDADVKAVLDKILTLPGKAIISNPCIELWFALHSNDHFRPLSSEMMCKSLCNSHPIWKSYSKGVFNNDQGQYLLNNIPAAVTRAKRLVRLQNPSTNMYEFIEALENEKKLR